jgi:hypothetical protein
LDLNAGVDTAANRAAIEQAVNSLVLAKQVDASELLLSEIDSAIATVTNQYTRIAPSSNAVCGLGEIFAVPSITWI